MNSLAIYTHTYPISSFLVNTQKRLGLFGLLNLLQDTAWLHATELGHGYEEMLKDGTAWVLTRQRLEMEAWPTWGDSITIRTWVRPIHGFFATRDLEIYLPQKGGTAPPPGRGSFDASASDSGIGQKIGQSTTSWLTMDIRTRKPTEVRWKGRAEEFRTDGALNLTPMKIELKDGLQPLARFQVRNSDLDLNGHVNNTRYAQWLLDAISLDAHQNFNLHAYDVNFIAETKSGDVIEIQAHPIDSARADRQHFQFQGVREGDRKVVFAARFEAAERQSSPDARAP
ncbi:MAG: thioesterase [Bdellovibrionaceae bacterium]|nr:thioesterase [Pseudobdellovibrionaceae bacterium]